MTFSDAIAQMLTNTLTDMLITSAGDRGRPINRVEFVEVQAADFESILEQEIRDIVDEYFSQKETAEVATENESGGVEEKDKKGGKTGQALGVARMGMGAAANPASLVATGLKFLPHAALVAFVISIIPMIFNEMTRAGSQWDLRFKRIMLEEYNALLDRQEQHNTRIGTRQVIIQSRRGFINTNGASSNYNNQRVIRKGWLGLEDMSELSTVNHAKALW